VEEVCATFCMAYLFSQIKAPRVPSSLSVRKDSPLPRNEIPSTSSRSMAPPMSRTSSANTTLQIQSRNFSQTSLRLAEGTTARQPLSPVSKTAPVKASASPEATSSESASSSDSSSDSELPVKSRLLRRPPRPSAHRYVKSEDADDDDDAPLFLPFSTPIELNTHDPSATLRGDPRQMSRRAANKKPEDVGQSHTSDSSASSAAPNVRPSQREVSQVSRQPGPLSPRRTAELAGKSPMYKGKGLGREGSDGSPSMGSSFSDLDDASVTQSALEEALASKMQAGGMASRMSTISQALRSRYL